jgi:hypothetical protein
MAGNPTSAGAGAQAATAPRFNIFEKPVSAPRPAAQGSRGVFDCGSACGPAGSVERPAAVYWRRRRATPILTWVALLAAVVALVAAWAQLRGDAPDRAVPRAPVHDQPRAREPRQNAAARRGVRPQRRTRKRAKPHRATRPRRSTRRRAAPQPTVVPAPRAPLLSPPRAIPRKPVAPRRLPARVAPGAPPEFM